MEDYLIHWWNGELATHYTFLDLQIHQLNKILKVGQYTIGLLALFELIQFSTVMAKTRVVLFLSVIMIRF